MELKELHSLIDSIFTLDKTNGDLGKALAQLKDVATNLHGEISTRDKTISDNAIAYEDLKKRNDTLVEANGKMLIERTVTSNPTPVGQAKQSEENEFTIDNLLYGEEK